VSDNLPEWAKGAELMSGNPHFMPDRIAELERENAALRAKVEALTWERDEAERREKQWEVDYAADLKQIIAERDRLKEALSEARQLAESARWGERGERG